MATIPCPQCGTQVKKPTNIVGLVLGIFAFLFIGGFCLILVCLAAIAAVGENAEAEFQQVAAEISSIDGVEQGIPATQPGSH